MRLIDLRDEAHGRVQGAAFGEARQLRRGETLTLLVAHEPSLLMKGLNLRLRDELPACVTDC